MASKLVSMHKIQLRNGLCVEINFPLMHKHSKFDTDDDPNNGECDAPQKADGEHSLTACE